MTALCIRCRRRFEGRNCAACHPPPAHVYFPRLPEFQKLVEEAERADRHVPAKAD